MKKGSPSQLCAENLSCVSNVFAIWQVRRGLERATGKRSTIDEIGACEGLPAITHRDGILYGIALHHHCCALNLGHSCVVNAVFSGHLEAYQSWPISRQSIGMTETQAERIGLHTDTYTHRAFGLKRVAISVGESQARQAFANGLLEGVVHIEGSRPNPLLQPSTFEVIARPNGVESRGNAAKRGG